MPGADENQNQSSAGAQADSQVDPAGAQGQGAETTTEPKASMTLEEALAEVSKLRKENASRRTANKGLEDQKKQLDEMMGKMKQALGIKDETVAPEAQIESLKAQNAAMQLDLELNQIASREQIPHDLQRYFNFRFREELAGLGEGEEIGEERINELIAEVKGMKSSTPGRTGIVPGQRSPSQDAGVTVEQFAKMPIMEKGHLQMKNPDLYTRLFNEAKQKRML